MRVQDYHSVSNSPHGSNLTEMGKKRPKKNKQNHKVLPVYNLYFLPLLQGPHLPTTAEDVHPQLRPTLLITAALTLQRPHLHIYFSIFSFKLNPMQLSATSIQQTNRDLMPKETWWRKFSRWDDGSAKDCTEIKTFLQAGSPFLNQMKTVSFFVVIHEGLMPWTSVFKLSYSCCSILYLWLVHISYISAPSVVLKTTVSESKTRWRLSQDQDHKNLL